MCIRDRLNAGSTVAGTFAYNPAAGGVLGAGTQTLNVTFTPTDATDYSTAIATVQLTVNKATPAITWATPAPIVYGTPLGASQLDASSGGVAGAFVYTPQAGTVLAAGTQTLSAIFTPTDTTDYTLASASVQITVNKATPSIGWTAPAAITYGTPLSGAQLDASSPVAGTFVYTPALGAVLGAGSQTLTVIFNPTDIADYTTATATVPLTVNRATPPIAWATPAPIAYGIPLSANQLNATSTVSGTFAYSPSVGAILGVGSQALSVTFTPADSVDYTNAVATTTLTVNKAPSIVSLAASSSSTPAGSPVTLTATVQSTTSGTPSGTVTFLNGASKLGSAPVLNGIATFTVALLAGGTDQIIASYAGDSDFLPSTSISVSITVLLATTNSALSASPNPTLTGGAVTFSANVSSLGGTPPGSVSFYDGTALLDTVTLVSGSATLSTNNLTVGSHNITAAYGGGPGFSPSTSNSVVVSIQDFSILASPTSGTVYTGEPASYTVTITPEAVSYTHLDVYKRQASGSAGDYTLTGTVIGGELEAPSGNVTFTDNTTALIPGTAVLGAAALAQRFVSAPTLTGFSGPQADVLADVNGDGIPDLLMGDGNQITLAIGVGDGTFHAPSIIPVSYTHLDVYKRQAQGSSKGLDVF